MVTKTGTVSLLFPLLIASFLASVNAHPASSSHVLLDSARIQSNFLVRSSSQASAAQMQKVLIGRIRARSMESFLVFNRGDVQQLTRFYAPNSTFKLFRLNMVLRGPKSIVAFFIRLYNSGTRRVRILSRHFAPHGKDTFLESGRAELTTYMANGRTSKRNVVYRTVWSVAGPLPLVLRDESRDE